MIRPAEPTDYEAITAIRDATALDVSRLNDSEYVARIERHGFLVPVEIPFDQFIAHVPNYIVGEDERGEVVGFLRVDEVQEMAPNEVPRWSDPELEEIYWGMPHANIGKVAVLPEVSQRGLGSGLLAEAEQRARAQGISHLFSFIVRCKPPTNYSSIGFHERNGFRIAAPVDSQRAYGIEEYLCALYVKELS